MAGALAYDGPFWASASRAMPVVVAGSAMGLINAVGNLGGFVGPYVGGFLQDVTHGSFMATSVFLAACLLAAGLVMLTLRKGGDRPTAEAAPHAAASPSERRG
jgi:nitrate/nitrite transporter NarK